MRQLREEKAACDQCCPRYAGGCLGAGVAQLSCKPLDGRFQPKHGGERGE